MENSDGDGERKNGSNLSVNEKMFNYCSFWVVYHQRRVNMMRLFYSSCIILVEGD